MIVVLVKMNVNRLLGIINKKKEDFSFESPFEGKKVGLLLVRVNEAAGTRSFPRRGFIQLLRSAGWQLATIHGNYNDSFRLYIYKPRRPASSSADPTRLLLLLLAAYYIYREKRTGSCQLFIQQASYIPAVSTAA